MKLKNGGRELRRNLMIGMKDEMNSWEKLKQVIGKFWLLQIVVVAWQNLSIVFVNLLFK